MLVPRDSDRGRCVIRVDYSGRLAPLCQVLGGDVKTNRNKHKIRPPSQNEMGLASNDAGKGDIPRSCFSDDFKDNFEDIAGMGTAEGFKKGRGGKQVKSYGKPAVPTIEFHDGPPQACHAVPTVFPPQRW